jgi:hypothetical protein
VIPIARIIAEFSARTNNHHPLKYPNEMDTGLRQYGVQKYSFEPDLMDGQVKNLSLQRYGGTKTMWISGPRQNGVV